MPPEAPAPATPGRPIAAFGATPHAGGTTFRVWALHATHVFVTGEWNGWRQDADELRVEAPGVFAGDVAAAKPGQKYQYVLETDGKRVVRSDPRARAMTASNGPGVIVDASAYAWASPRFKAARVPEQVLYELHLGTFNVPAGQPRGTWRSAADKLDHLAALGVTTIEVMPPAEFPGDRSWGYNPSVPFALEHAYGTPDDARAFVDQAHARGIGVVIDVVYNHWGPNDMPMWCFDGDCLGAGGAYFYTDARQKTDWGPRPDFGRREVRDYIRDNALAWLTEYRADGLRWDSTVNIRQWKGMDLPEGWTVMQVTQQAIRTIAPESLQIAEDFRGSTAIGKPVAAGGAGFDAQPDGAFFHPLDDALTSPSDAGRDMLALRAAITNRLGAVAAGRVIYTESHDEVANGRQRIPEMITPGDAASFFARKRSTLGAAVVLTSPGLPMLFQGQELLEDKWFSDDRPIDWSKADSHAEILALYRDLVALRRNRDGTTRGLQGENVNVFHASNTTRVIAYHRWQSGGAGDDVVVVANFSNVAFPRYDMGLPRPGTWHARLSSDDQRYGADYGGLGAGDVVASASPRDGLPASGSVALGRYGVVILSQ
jgi:1,4-alpha-glucan branching enzyme